MTVGNSFFPLITNDEAKFIHEMIKCPYFMCLPFCKDRTAKSRFLLDHKKLRLRQPFCNMRQFVSKMYQL